MNPSFQRAMAEATRLTRAGDLLQATALIQATLGGAAAPVPAGHARIDPVRRIDERMRADAARLVDDRAATDGARRRPAIARRCLDGDVIDVQARDIASPAARPESPAAPGRFIDGTHADAAGTRAFKLYVPPAWHGQALPLVVMLHGCTQDPDDFAAGTGMNDAARAGGFFVLYPAQAQNANASRCWNWFKHNHQGRGRGEPALLAAMTHVVIKRYGIDARRVYVAGLSAGGAMAAILGDAYPDLFAAVGVHSGLPTGSARDVKSAFAAMKRGSAAVPAGQAPPTIVFHGDQDAVVHPVNGEKVVASCAGAAGALSERARSGNGRAYTRRIYRDAGGRVVAEHWTVHGAGHAWSGGRSQGSYTDATGPDATAQMLRFFLEHPMGR